jgi:hypothetical protein
MAKYFCDFAAGRVINYRNFNYLSEPFQRHMLASS